MEGIIKILNHSHPSLINIAYWKDATVTAIASLWGSIRKRVYAGWLEFWTEVTIYNFSGHSASKCSPCLRESPHCVSLGELYRSNSLYKNPMNQISPLSNPSNDSKSMKPGFGQSDLGIWIWSESLGVLPGGLVVKHWPRFNLWSRKISCAAGQLSLCSRAQELQLLSPHATITKACMLRAHASQEKPLQWKAHAPQLESSPCSLQLEEAC